MAFAAGSSCRPVRFSNEKPTPKEPTAREVRNITASPTQDTARATSSITHLGSFGYPLGRSPPIRRIPNAPVVRVRPRATTPSQIVHSCTAAHPYICTCGAQRPPFMSSIKCGTPTATCCHVLRACVVSVRKERPLQPEAASRDGTGIYLNSSPPSSKPFLLREFLHLSLDRLACRVAR